MPVVKTQHAIRGMHSGFIPRVFEASYKATLFRLRNNNASAERAEKQLERMLREARDNEMAPIWWKNDVRYAAERGREAGKDHFNTFGAGPRKNANPFRPTRAKRDSSRPGQARGTSPRGKRRDPAPNELSSEAQELLLFLDNDEPLYRRKFDFLKNVYTKMKRGTYNRELARKLWMYYVEDAAKKYEKEFLNPGEWSRVFPPTVRREVAKELEERERHMIERGEYKDFPPVPARAGIYSKERRKSRQKPK